MEYKKDQYKISFIFQFADKKIENDFLEHNKAANIILTRIILIGFGIYFLSFSIFLYYDQGVGKQFFISLGLRSFGLLITVITGLTLGLFKQYKNTLTFVTVIEVIIFAIYLLDLYNLQSERYALQFMTVMGFILAVLLIPNLWINSFFACTAITLSYIIYSVIFKRPAETPNVAERGIYLMMYLAGFACFIINYEISKRKQYAAEKTLEHMSFTDKLTNVNNRGRFEAILNLWIKNKRHDPFCLLFFDIDYFKKINDNFGHATGDAVLVETAAIVSANIRDDDVFARWGGEEFVLLISKTGIDRAVELAERLRSKVENNPYADVGKVTISIGVAQYQRDINITDENPGLNFIKRADEKMYEAKKTGRNKVVAEYLPAPPSTPPVRK